MTSTKTTERPISGSDEGWRDAGAAWGHSPRDWAYLFEPYARDAAEHIFDSVDVGSATDLFDMACGSGYATARAARRGARTHGLDASEALIDIARIRNPRGNFRVGTMFDLPYPDDSFDLVTSFNGIWGGCETAIAEAFRILRPGGHIAITFWGPGNALDYRDMFIALGGLAQSTQDEMITMASISGPGIAESMFAEAGFATTERGGTQAIHEFPDSEIAWRCLRSPGLMVPALQQLGDAGLRDVLMPTIEEFKSTDGSYRITNELTHVIGRKPAA